VLQISTALKENGDGLAVPMALVGARELVVQDVFAFAGLENHVAFFDSREDALACLGVEPQTDGNQ
jgi:mannitol/fructose-specific phosphotransferase system IIA component